jgi:hypothetical protein
MAGEESNTALGAIREVPLGSLRPIDTPAHKAPRAWLQALSDSELVVTVHTPENGDFVLVNTRSGALSDGNGRVWELLRRADDDQSSIQLDLLIPVQEYAPDLSMFPDLE